MSTHKIMGLIVLTLTSSSLLLSGCSSLSQVIPKEGPSMEQQYDGMKKVSPRPDADWVNESGASKKTSKSVTTSDSSLSTEENNDDADVSSLRKQVQPVALRSTALKQSVPTSNMWNSFHKVSNPTLTLFIYPHLSGNDELPVPGYTTAFNAYDHDHFALPQDA